MDGIAGSDPRDDSAGAIQDVACCELKVSAGADGPVGSSDDRERAAGSTENHRHLMHLLHLFHCRVAVKSEI
jgi:hypothetical protein